MCDGPEGATLVRRGFEKPPAPSCAGSTRLVYWPPIRTGSGADPVPSGVRSGHGVLVPHSTGASLLAGVACIANGSGPGPGPSGSVHPGLSGSVPGPYGSGSGSVPGPKMAESPETGPAAPLTDEASLAIHEPRLPTRGRLDRALGAGIAMTGLEIRSRLCVLPIYKKAPPPM